MQAVIVFLGNRDSSVVEGQTLDEKVMGLILGKSGRNLFSPGSNLIYIMTLYEIQ